MRVDEAGQQRSVAEIDNLRVIGTLDRGAHFNDALALDQRLAGRGNVASLDVEQAGGVKNDRAGWCRARLGRERSAGNQKRCCQERENAGHYTGILSARDASNTCSTSV